jgi:hypothetical protein
MHRLGIDGIDEREQAISESLLFIMQILAKGIRR